MASFSPMSWENYLKIALKLSWLSSLANSVIAFLRRTIWVSSSAVDG